MRIFQDGELWRWKERKMTNVHFFKLRYARVKRLLSFFSPPPSTSPPPPPPPDLLQNICINPLAEMACVVLYIYVRHRECQLHQQ